MEEHVCRPPRERRPIADDRWDCPECGRVWQARALGPTDPAMMLDFGTDAGASSTRSGSRSDPP
jgi:ribosomal protein L37AE/L43A